MRGAARGDGRCRKRYFLFGDVEEANPLLVMREISKNIRFVDLRTRGRGSGLPACFLGGWARYAGYDTVRYVEPEKLASPPADDRGLADMHFGFYDGVVVFDNADKLVYVVELALVGPGDDAAASTSAVMKRLESGPARSRRTASRWRRGWWRARRRCPRLWRRTRAKRSTRGCSRRALEYIRAGDIFQVVLGQRFERKRQGRSVRRVPGAAGGEPEPVHGVSAGRGCILVASSPEILCRVRRHQALGTEHQGKTRIHRDQPSAGGDAEARRDGGEDRGAGARAARGREGAGRAHHAGGSRAKRRRAGARGRLDQAARGDGDRAVQPRDAHQLDGDGRAAHGLDAWDALAAALPVGTISGQPKVRAMQIIDELEPVRRGPYGGGMGYVGLDGEMDIALRCGRWWCRRRGTPRAGSGRITCKPRAGSSPTRRRTMSIRRR